MLDISSSNNKLLLRSLILNVYCLLETVSTPNNNKFSGDKKDLPPDPVNQYDHKLPIAIVEPIHRLRNHEILEVD